MKGLSFALILILAAVPAKAEIFKWILPDGSIEYSDRPPAEGAEKVELSPLVTYTPPPVAAQPAGTQQGKAEFDGYDSFNISSPANNATVRDNAGNVSLTFAVIPTLFKGHAIEIFVDGEKFGQIGVPVVTLSNVSRGNHRIYATIVDDTGTELVRTSSINITMQRVSKILSDEAKPPGEETPFDDAIQAIGGGRSPGGPRTPGGPRSGGGPRNPAGPKNPGGPVPRFGATPIPSKPSTP